MENDTVTSDLNTGSPRANNKPKRIVKPLKNITPRQMAVQELLEKSQMPINAIAKAMNYHESYIPQLRRKLESTSIVSAKAKRLAKKAVIETLEMKAVTEKKLDNKGNIVEVEDKPSHSNRLTAAAMVLDRSEPIIQHHQNENVSINLDGTLLDYSKFRRKD